MNTTVSRRGGLIATPLLGVIISLVFASRTGGNGADPFATTGLGPDGQAAAVAAFRVATIVAAALCAGGGLIAWAFLPRGRLE